MQLYLVVWVCFGFQELVEALRNMVEIRKSQAQAQSLLR